MGFELYYDLLKSGMKAPAEFHNQNYNVRRYRNASDR